MTPETRAARVAAIREILHRVGARNDRWVRCSLCHEPWTDDHAHEDPGDGDLLLYHRQEGGTHWTDYDGMARAVVELLEEVEEEMSPASAVAFAIAAENEACASLCERMAEYTGGHGEPRTPGAYECAAAIRARA